MKPESIAIGRVTSTHGLQGEVKIYPLTDFPERFNSLDDIVLETVMGQQVMHVEGIKYFKNMLILKFREVSTVDEAEKLRGATLQVSSEQLVPLPDGHYYIFQIIGLSVMDEDGEELGVVEDIQQTGSNDVYYVKNNTTGEQILIPALKEVVRSIDLDRQRIVVSLLPGLRDLGVKGRGKTDAD